jgi:hypothetical protein
MPETMPIEPAAPSLASVPAASDHGVNRVPVIERRNNPKERSESAAEHLATRSH